MKWVYLLMVCLLCSCRRGMVDQPRTKPLAEDTFFANGSGARPLPAHTVARGHLDEDEAFFTGMTRGQLVDAFPAPLTGALLARGRGRYDIYCAVCHGPTGDGNGMIVQRGFPRPPSLHDPRLREAPIGHLFDVIKNGYGVMSSYATRVEPEDRWAIAAYIRALQLSQTATLGDVSPPARAELESQPK